MMSHTLLTCCINIHNFHMATFGSQNRLWISWHLKSSQRGFSWIFLSTEDQEDFPPELLAKLQEIEWGKNKYGRGPRLSGKGKALASMLFRLVLVVVVDVRHTFSRSTEKGSIKKQTSGSVIGADIFFACQSISLFPRWTHTAFFGWLFLAPPLKMATNRRFYSFK